MKSFKTSFKIIQNVLKSHWISFDLRPNLLRLGLRDPQQLLEKIHGPVARRLALAKLRPLLEPVLDVPWSQAAPWKRFRKRESSQNISTVSNSKGFKIKYFKMSQKDVLSLYLELFFLHKFY